MPEDNRTVLQSLNDRLAELLAEAGVAAERRLHSVAVQDTDLEFAITAIWENPDRPPDGRVRTGGVEIAIRSPTLFDSSAYEYSYGGGLVDQAAHEAAMSNWIAFDFPVLVQAASGREAGCQIMKMARNANNGIASGTWQIYAGPMAYLAGDSGEQPCCRDCLFTMSLPALLPLMARPKSFALKLVAAKDEDGTTNADCRLNGEDVPEAMETIARAAKGWPAAKGLQLRRQYLYFKAPPRLDA